ncbi:MAG TPA: putative Ig domain-containing protein [Dehalococcoidia bacterium]|nr:putative Ig domain-containing protein [Dehalococcoidia bacterium]
MLFLLGAGTPIAVPATQARSRTSSSLPDATNGIHRGIMFLRCYSEFGSWAGSSPTCQQTAQTSLATVNGKLDTGFIYDDAPLTKFADPSLAGTLGVSFEFDRFPAYPYNYQDFTSSQYTSGNYAMTLNWMTANHPDWIIYKCDGTTVAWTYGAVPADGNSAAFIPFDISNPQARAYYFNSFVKPAIDNGAPLIFEDNVTVTNAWGRCGHYDTSGNWVQEWTGAYNDTTYEQAVFSWQQYLYSAIKAENPNVIVAFNYDPAASSDDPSIYNEFFQHMDLLVNESGFDYWGDHRITDSQWQAEAQVIAATQAAGVGTLHQESINTTYVSGITLDDKNWGIGNYLLFKGAHDYIAFSPYYNSLPDYGSYVDLPEYAAAIGSPSNSMYQSQGVYRRDYSGGLVLVNPSSSASYTVNLGATYKDMDGNSIGPSLTLAPATAEVLLSGSGGSQAPTFTSAPSTSFTVGQAGSFTVTASGSPAPSLSESGALPSGVSFNASTGVLSGTPAAGTAGSYPLQFTASNSAGTANQQFTLTVSNASTPPSSNPTGTLLMYPSTGSYHVGDTFSVTLYAFGNGQTFTAAGATVTVTSNLSIVGLYAGNCNFSYSTTPSASNLSFAGTIAGGSSSCVVYYLSVRATGAGTGYVSMSNAYMQASDGSNILKASTDGAFTIS